MCHNHSHAKVQIDDIIQEGEAIWIQCSTLQKFTIEMPSGGRLMMPPGRTFLLRCSLPADLSALASLVTEELSESMGPQEEAALYAMGILENKSPTQ